MIRYPADLDKKIRILESLSNLEHNEAFKTVTDWLIDEAGRVSKENNTIANKTQLRWSQGHFQLLDDLLSKIVTARNTLEKLRNQSPPQGSA
jgi:hypothetical protein